MVTILVLCFSSCIGLKNGSSSGRISKYVEEFFVGDGVIQYFVKPLKYTGIDQKDATLDATLRNKDKTTDSLTVNFSLKMKTKDEIQKVVISNGQNTITINDVLLIYKEKTDDFYTHRASIKLPFAEYMEYLLTKDHTIEATNASEKTTIYPTSKSKKAITSLREKFITRIN